MEWMLIVIIMNSGYQSSPATVAGGVFVTQEACETAGKEMEPGVRGGFGWRFSVGYVCAPVVATYD